MYRDIHANLAEKVRESFLNMLNRQNKSGEIEKSSNIRHGSFAIITLMKHNSETLDFVFSIVKGNSSRSKSSASIMKVQ